MISKTFTRALKPALALRSFATSAFALPPLPYARDALSPAISENTMKCHYDGHHQTYIAFNPFYVDTSQILIT